MTNDLEARRERYYSVSSRIAQIDNRRLLSMFGSSEGRGWGQTHTIKVGTSKLFVKRIPLTDLECDNLYSTENLFNLPTFYNYGVGSAGFGAFRELVAHVKTTNWVLSGAIANFPLMYHYRIVPCSPTRPEWDSDRRAQYVRYWNSDENVSKYLQARHAARHEIVIFLEHFPHVLADWFTKNLDKAETVTREMLNTCTFLREHGVIHFDAHFRNILVRDNIPYLTDFGLVLDKTYLLGRSEQLFFKLHIDYDSAEYLECLGAYLSKLYRDLSPVARLRVSTQCGVADDTDYFDLITRLLDNVQLLHSRRLMKLDDSYVAQLIKHRGIIHAMARFYVALRANDRKDTPFVTSTIRRLLTR